jgi:hypothetical protein
MNVLYVVFTSILLAKATYAESALEAYFDPKRPLTVTTGSWYEIVSWAARTYNCENSPESMACMACCANVPDFAKEMGVAPIGISNDVWFSPETSATCGMCLRVYMPLDTNGEQLSASAYMGTTPYYQNVEKNWAYNAKIEYDDQLEMPYFTAIIVEWFDRNQTDGVAMTYPVQRLDTDKFGDWVVHYRPVPCPVNGHGLSFEFMDYSKEYPFPIPANQTDWTNSAASVGAAANGVGKELCDNQLNQPCGNIAPADPNRYPLKFIKMKVGSYRFPVGAVSMEVEGREYTMKRSGDNFWSPVGGLPKWLELTTPVTFKVQCLDGSSAEWVSAQVVPGDCLCAYQDPRCIPCEVPDVQC